MTDTARKPPSLQNLELDEATLEKIAGGADLTTPQRSTTTGVRFDDTKLIKEFQDPAIRPNPSITNVGINPQRPWVEDSVGVSVACVSWSKDYN